MKILHGIFDLSKVSLLEQENLDTNITDKHTRVNQYFSRNLNDVGVGLWWEFFFL